jgi:hypothetical protein
VGVLHNDRVLVLLEGEERREFFQDFVFEQARRAIDHYVRIRFRGAITRKTPEPITELVALVGQARLQRRGGHRGDPRPTWSSPYTPASFAGTANGPSDGRPVGAPRRRG